MTSRGRPLALLLLASASGCIGTPAGRTVETYIEHLRAGRYEQAYALLGAESRAQLSLEQWKTAMHIDMLADVQDLKIKRLVGSSASGTCVYTQLDFTSHRDDGPYGHYVFYLQREDEGLRIVHVQTYDRIEGEGAIKTTHYDDSAAPFSCPTRS